MADNNIELQQLADSHGHTDSAHVGLMSEINAGIDRFWAKRKGTAEYKAQFEKKGFRRKANFKSEATLEREAEEAKKKALAREAANKKPTRSISFVEKLLKSVNKPEFKNIEKRALVNLQAASYLKKTKTGIGKQRLRLSKILKILESHNIPHGSHNYNQLIAGIETIKERVQNG